MTARILGYYSAWEKELAVCSGCGWEGPLAAGSRDFSEACLAIECPACFGPILAVISYPTLEEYRAQRLKLSLEERAFGDAQAAFQEVLAKSEPLTSAALPDLDGEALDLLWCVEGPEAVLRMGERTLARIVAGYGHWERFEQACRVLMARYGGRLRSLEVAPGAWMDLLGDTVAAGGWVEAAQARIRDSWEAARAAR